jgi:tetratricopeptide (TPR) repeat protein
MKLSLLLFVLVPFISLSQTKRSLTARKLYDSAIEQYNNGNSQEALKLFEQCVVEDPAFAEAHLNISYIVFASGDYEKALQSAKKAYEFNKFQGPVFAQVGKCFYHLEQYDSAAWFIQQGIGFGAKSELDYLYLAKSLSELGEHRDAAFYYGKAIEANGTNALTYNERGSAYYQLGEYELAEADFKKSLELNPSSAGVYSNLANVALALGDNETAISYINEGISKAGEDEKVQLLILKGNYYKNTGDFANATATYSDAYELDNENAVILNNQASVLIELEDYEGALDKCNRALELDGEMMEAYFNRGIVHEMLRNVEDACMDWEQAFILGSEVAEEYLNSPICNE